MEECYSPKNELGHSSKPDQFEMIDMEIEPLIT